MRYAKVFDSIWEGSMRGKGDPLFVFVNLLTHAGQDGVVDRHWQTIIDETGLSKDRVLAALEYLLSPDPESRTPDEGGRRIVLLDPHRTWGWRIVNHKQYRDLCTKTQNAERQARFRERNANVTVCHKDAVDVGVGVSVSGFKEWSREQFEAQCRLCAPGVLDPAELQDFMEYWLEPSSSGRFRFTLEKTWETKRRMNTAVRMIFDQRRAGRMGGRSGRRSEPEKPSARQIWDEAIQHAVLKLEEVDKTFGRSSDEFAKAMSVLGTEYGKLGKNRGGQSLVDEAIDVLEFRKRGIPSCPK